MTGNESQMRRELAEIPEAVETLLVAGAGPIAAAAEAVAACDPPVVATVARGSSDHVCTLLKYACELLLGVPVASVGPSVASIYGTPLKLGGGVCLAVSQSGRSPDIVAMAENAARSGALTVAITNDPASPLAVASAHALPIHAGPELSVAATKTFVTSAVAGLMLLAAWKRDEDLRTALSGLPEALARAGAVDWPEVRAALGGRHSLYVLGRGPSWAVANEVALKFKEVARIHAESYSAAEVLHGPVSIVDEGFPVICLAAGDAAEAGLAAAADGMAAKGAACFVTSSAARRATRIDHVRTGHGLTDPLALVVSGYAMVERLAVERGIDPDRPRHLSKITETI